MLSDFDQLGSGARVWVYQANRAMNQAEQQEILQKLSAFLNQWAAHGSALQASGKIVKDHFLIIGVDESFQMASGCSIDSSVRFMQDLGQEYKIDFFQRTNLAFLEDDIVKLTPLAELKSAVEEGRVKPDSLFFNNTIQTKGELDSSWCVKASESWLKRYFSTTLSV